MGSPHPNPHLLSSAHCRPHMPLERAPRHRLQPLGCRSRPPEWPVSFCPALLKLVEPGFHLLGSPPAPRGEPTCLSSVVAAE